MDRREINGAISFPKELITINGHLGVVSFSVMVQPWGDEVGGRKGSDEKEGDIKR